jgi:hypothetical protein
MENTNNSNTTIVVALLSLLIGGLIGYFIGMQQNRTSAMTVNQTDTTADGTTRTANPTAMVATGDGTPVAIDGEENAMDKGDSMTVTLGEQNDLGQSGTATLTEENGQVKVVLSLTGGTFAEPQPAHIHMGMCPKPGEVVYPLTNVVNGQSETMLATTMADLKAKGDLAVNVHKSAAEASVYTACGNLE